MGGSWNKGFEHRIAKRSADFEDHDQKRDGLDDYFKLRMGKRAGFGHRFGKRLSRPWIGRIEKQANIPWHLVPKRGLGIPRMGKRENIPWNLVTKRELGIPRMGKRRIIPWSLVPTNWKRGLGIPRMGKRATTPWNQNSSEQQELEYEEPQYLSYPFVYGKRDDAALYRLIK